MSDYISRQAAVDALDSIGSVDTEADREYARNIFEAIPTADVAPVVHGRWIKLYTDNYKCSECGDWWCSADNEMVEDFLYCPHCGAKMDGGEDE